MYTITLYDLPSYAPVHIQVDERLVRHSHDSEHLLAAQPSCTGELWACYIEKAVAIHCGGWDKIDGGFPFHAWRMLTGLSSHCLLNRSSHTDLWLDQSSNILYKVDQARDLSLGSGPLQILRQFDSFPHNFSSEIQTAIVIDGNSLSSHSHPQATDLQLLHSAFLTIHWLVGCKDVCMIFNHNGGYSCWGNDDALVTNDYACGQNLKAVPWPEVGGSNSAAHKIDQEELFERMCIWDDNSFMLCASTKDGSDTMNTDGIVDGHAYTVLDCVNDAAGIAGMDLVQVQLNS